MLLALKFFLDNVIRFVVAFVSCTSINKYLTMTRFLVVRVEAFRRIHLVHTRSSVSGCLDETPEKHSDYTSLFVAFYKIMNAGKTTQQ